MDDFFNKLFFANYFSYFDGSTSGRFDLVLSNVAGRLIYKELTK